MKKKKNLFETEVITFIHKAESKPPFELLY